MSINQTGGNLYLIFLNCLLVFYPFVYFFYLINMKICLKLLFIQSNFELHKYLVNKNHYCK